MFSLGMIFDMDGTSDLAEQLAYLKNIYMSLRNDFIDDRCLEEETPIPEFVLNLKTEVRKSSVGPRVHIEVRNREAVIKGLKERKEKIEKLLNGIDELTEMAKRIEAELNGVNNIVESR